MQCVLRKTVTSIVALLRLQEEKATLGRVKVICTHLFLQVTSVCTARIGGKVQAMYTVEHCSP